MLLVGRHFYDKNLKKFSFPEIQGFSTYKLTKTINLSPNILRNNGSIVQNIWNFSQIHEKVDPLTKYSDYRKTNMIWSHPAETHVISTPQGNSLTPEFINWRNKGLMSNYVINRPGGKNKVVMYVEKESSLEDSQNSQNFVYKFYTDYATAFKNIYIKNYIEAVKTLNSTSLMEFNKLQERLKNGENIIISDFQGPHQEDLPYYMKTYNIDQNSIVNNCIVAEVNILNLMLNDKKHFFGPGYCLAAALLGIENQLNSTSNFVESEENDIEEN